MFTHQLIARELLVPASILLLLATLSTPAPAQQEPSVAQLYLGLTLARQGDRKDGLRRIEGGMKGIKDFLNYITTTFANEFGQFWDPGRDIRKAIDNNLTMIAGGNFDWPTLISNGEALGLNFEQEPDRAQRDEEQQMKMNMGR